MKKLLSTIKQEIFHTLKVYPACKLIQKINQHFPLKGTGALEAFASTRALQTGAYKHYYFQQHTLIYYLVLHLKKNK
ncbi:hypothetical protein CNR22_19430 [Sphingobacteriaceae bacterium]|nr:hypothetical protein CNR22_19430 [Sphingobacteriaceae bacterium]